MKKIEKKLMELKVSIQNLVLYSEEGVLTVEKLYETKYKVEDELLKLSNNFDEITQLRIEKIAKSVRLQPRHGAHISPDHAKEHLAQIDSLIDFLVEKILAKPIPKLKRVKIIPKNNPYSGISYLRLIFAEAKSKIFIRDNYLRQGVLDVLSEFIIDNKVSVQLLIKNSKELKPFLLYCSKFKLEHNATIEVRYTVLEHDHPRYIVVDDLKVYIPDHSLDQWGEKTVNVTEITSSDEVNTINKNLETEWVRAETNLLI